MTGSDAQFAKWIQKLDYKVTRQRERIARVFFQRGGHMTADELFDEVRKGDPRLSLATVYRTLNLLCESGLAVSHQFGEGFSHFEVNAHDQAHHDHLICTGCSKIEEFFNEKIERLQDQVASQHQFIVTSHRLELYGLCRRCQNAGANE